MLYEMILVSGWLFWIVIAVFIAVEVFLLTIDDDSHSAAVGVALACLIGLVLFSDAFKGARPVWAIILTAVYLAAGVAWAFFKWWSFVANEAARLREAHKTSSTLSWEAFAKPRMPSASNNKSRIVAWMTLWPFSFSWWALTWPRKVFSWLYERLSMVFDRIAARSFGINPKAQ